MCPARPSQHLQNCPSCVGVSVAARRAGAGGRQAGRADSCAHVAAPPPAAAEAVNFAMEEWLEVGCAAVPCTCSCLPDGVALDMGIFIPELREGSSGEGAAAWLHRPNRSATGPQLDGFDLNEGKPTRERWGQREAGQALLQASREQGVAPPAQCWWRGEG